MKRSKNRPEKENTNPETDESKRSKRSRTRERSGRQLEPRWQRLCDLATD